MIDPLRVAVVGATGYAGFELAKLLLRHPNTQKPTFYLRDAHADVRCLTELYPQLRGWGDAPCKPLSVHAIAQSGADVVFLSTPHEASLELVPAFACSESEAANRGLERCVSLSYRRDFRELVQAAARQTRRRSAKRFMVCRSFTRQSCQRRVSSRIQAAIRRP